MLTLADVEVTLAALPEDDTPGGHFGYDIEEENAEAVADVYRRAGRSEWGWCVAHVRVALPGTSLHADAYLGGCSYESADDFKAGGYYDDMVAEALAELQAEAGTIAAKVCK